MEISMEISKFKTRNFFPQIVRTSEGSDRSFSRQIVKVIRNFNVRNLRTRNFLPQMVRTSESSIFSQKVGLKGSAINFREGLAIKRLNLKVLPDTSEKVQRSEG